MRALDPLCRRSGASRTLNPRKALLVAVPLIVALVLVLSFLGFFQSYVVIAVLVVLYALVSWANRRKFARQESQKKAS
jgi:4-hydroxybenzoate polyprenyltransferase